MIMAKDSHGNYVKIEDIKQQDSFKGISPINFKSNGDNLKNYRIYGNTISGESVGDRTKNLWDGIEPFSNTNTDTKMQLDIWFRFYPASASSSSVSAASAASNAQIGQHIIRTITPQEGYERLVVKHNGSSKDIIFISKILEVEKTYTVSFDITKNDVQTVSGVIISNIQIEENSQATDYEPYGYRVPMTVTNETDTETTNLYLPEQIKMVGDEAEYIDFKEQKQYRVRKNLLKNTATTRTYGRDDNNPEIYPGVTFTVNDNGSIICNGKTNVSYISVIIGNVNLSADSYIFSGNPNGVNSNNNTFKYQAYNNDLNLWFQDNENGINFELTEQTNISVRIVIYQDYDCNNLTFYPMIRKADIEDDTYEPYIENTELDVTIPALPTLSGTNTLSVNTNIKPSKVWGGLNDPRDILYVKDKLGNILFSKYYEIEDEPPLTYKAKKTGTLKNYRIYGNTVDGESVGDRTGNLFDGSWENKFIDTYGNTGYSTDRVLSSYVTVIPNQTYSVKSNMHIRSVHSYNGTTHTQALIDNVAGLDGATFTIPADSNSIRISLKKANDGTITPDDVEWCMLNIGSTALPYEPYGKYKIPVTLTADSAETTDIYLDEPLCKIGTYTDYADYENQKVIRKVARKVFDGAEQFNYNANNNTIDYIVPTIIVGSAATINCSSNHITSLSGDMNWQSRNIPDARYISASYSGGSSKIRFIWNDNNGVMDLSNLTAQLSTWYANGNPLVVDYIVETPVEEQITLPAISTLAGINTLTVGTEAQPSDIYLKGKIEKKPKIYYYSQDGQTLLYTESVLKGGNGTYSTTPTKPSTAQYTYTFVGWTA